MTRPTGPGWIVAVDTGGTYTDAIAVSSDGLIKVAKMPSTPADPGLAVERAVGALAATGVAPGDVRMLFHGTTIATNAQLTGGLARVVLATTEGFRDVLSYRNGTRPSVYDLEQPRPRELVPRRDRIEVAERLSGRGEVLTPLEEDEIDRVVTEIAGRRPAAVAVSFLFSYLDSRHEDALAQALAKRLPDVPVTVSSAVAREFREYPRTATAALNAGLRPVVGSYLAQLRSRVAQLGADAPLLIMQSSGGCLPAERADGEAHRLVLSGPAAGVAGAVALGAGYGLRRLVSLDMGGTSLDVCLVRDGVPPVTPTQQVGNDPILCPSVDIVTAGAGGGSIAWVDRVGRLRIGPQSAGASPGPAAFGRGGDRSTVTDAHVVAGTLPAEAQLAGGLTLDTGAARRAVAETGGQLGLGAADAADGIVQVAVAQMTAALRRVSVERGIDPREYTLVAFGGAGPLHAGLLLREASLGGVLVPRYPGLFAAAGLVSADLRIDESSTVLRVLELGLLPELASWYRQATARMTGQLRRDGIRASRTRVLASADCRFVGQGYELNIGVAPVTQRGLASLAARFRARHLQTYGHTDPAQQVEVVTLRLAAVGALSRPEPAALTRGGAAPLPEAQTARVRARMPGEQAQRSVPLYDRDRLLAGNWVPGPAIVHQLDATTLVLDGQRARVDAQGSLWLEEAQ
ncbi:MAG TPA: hydantoinase/oxoprolinase family protein [Streptosporangiaceae bacterium]